MLKRLFALCLAACLLAGCSAGPLDLVPRPSAPPQAPGPAAPTEAPARVLEVYDPAGALGESLEAYAAAQGVEIKKAATQEGAALAVTAGEPGPESAVDLAAQEGLVRVLAGLAAGGGESCYGLPLGGAQYGYLADETRLKALLGDGLDTADLQKASYGEWEAFIAALTAWIQAPAAAPVTLNGREYALAAEKSGPLENLAGVFTVAGEDQCAGPVLSPVLGTCYKTAEEAAAGGRTAKELTGALNSLWSFLELESASLAGPAGRVARGAGAAPLTRAEARQAYQSGTALFYRAALGGTGGAGEQSCLIPLKFSFDETDLHGGYGLEELAGRPVAVGGGWLAIPSAAEPSARAEAEAFLLWLYASEEGQKLAPKQSEAGGLPDLSAALPAGFLAAAQSRGEALLQKEDWTKADRAAYVGALLEQLT